MGVMAVRMLLESEGAPERSMLDTELVIRKSTVAIPRK
jgi:hypothetical protein